MAINYFMPKMSKFPNESVPPRKRPQRKRAKNCPQKETTKEGGMKQQPEFGLSEVYIDNHMALLPELKLGKRNTSEIEYILLTKV